MFSDIFPHRVACATQTASGDTTSRFRPGHQGTDSMNTAVLGTPYDPCMVYLPTKLSNF